ncbi:MAG TPA: VOC family protein, partial [Ignavibacteriaceae bacterium]
QYSALLSKVVRSKNGGGGIKNPINEPYEGLKKSQIEEYIDEYWGSGIQHIAITTNNIIATIKALRENGVEFLTVPAAYYDLLKGKKLSKMITEDIDELKECGILCDTEGKGYLLQLFTKPVGDRPTFFFEIIQRREGAEGFGQGNFQALFESIERDQELRGSLDREE